MTEQTSRWRLNNNYARRHHFAPLQGEGLESIEVGEGAQWNSYQQAFDEGHEEGVKQGYNEGRANGEEEGKRAGYAAGFHQGRNEGQEKGKQEIEQQLNEIIAPISALKALLEEGYEASIQEQQQFIVDLIRRVAHQVIRCELTLQPQQIVTLVEETMNTLPEGAKDIRIHLAPTAVTELQALAAEKVKDWHLVPDPNITQGGCRIVSEQYEADASVETRLDACMDQVEKHLAQQADGTTDTLSEKAKAKFDVGGKANANLNSTMDLNDDNELEL